MSFPADKIICSGCEFEAWETHVPWRIVYRFENGEEVAGGTSSGWCYNCDDYANIEFVDPRQLRNWLNGMQQKIAYCRSKAVANRAKVADLSKGFLGRFRRRGAIDTAIREIQAFDSEIMFTEKRIRHLDGLLAISKMRKARPRCLYCWTEKTSAVTFGANGIAHDFKHECGGYLMLGDSQGTRFNYGLNVTVYVLSSEGELLDTRVETPPKLSLEKFGL